MKLGLALAGGGFQAIAYIGAIQAFNELGIKFDYISGTSSGSLVAALYALGATPEEMRKIVGDKCKNLVKIDKSKLLSIAKNYMFGKEITVEGLISGSKIEDIINEVIKNKNIINISDMPIPCAFPTVDTISTKECISISRKDHIKRDEIDYIYDIPLSKAVRASMSFPGIIDTCNFGKYNFIDGGTKDNLPIQVLKDMGAEYTIGLSFDISKYEKSSNLFDVILRAVDLFSQKDVVAAQSLADIAIEIDTKGSSLLTIGNDNIDECIDIGYKTIKMYEKQILQ